MSRLFTNHGYDFIYIPFIQNNIKEESKDIILYNYPTISADFKNHPKNIPSQNIYDTLFSFLVNEKEPLKPGFIHYSSQTYNACIFSYTHIHFVSVSDLWAQINLYLKIIGNGSSAFFEEMPSADPPLMNVADKIDLSIINSIMFRPHKKTKHAKLISYKTEIEDRKKVRNKYEPAHYIDDDFNRDIADIDFPEEAFQVIDEIKTKISYLTQLGINEWVLQQLFTLDTTQKLSKLIITKDFSIILPDYDNREIHLTPLPKAVFLLFLKHPEGILFKNLSNHKRELMNIYLNLSNRESVDSMEKSIDDLVDSTKNAINEKCSRIREAFIKEFDERLAEHYFITGERYSPKRIKLDRDLVCWETEV